VPCRVAKAETWWPDKRDADGPAAHGAVAACHRCPAESACLAYALAADERFGVWGGTLPEDRKARLARTRPARRPEHGQEHPGLTPGALTRACTSPIHGSVMLVISVFDGG
jgi:WhiB family redox-sensing transcriptional regulator